MDDDSLRQVTKTQREYLALVSLRLSSKHIARIVKRSEKTIDVACTRALKASGEASRFTLADRIVATDPELLQSLIQRFSLSAKTLADLRHALPDHPIGADDESLLPRSWGTRPKWQKRIWAITIALSSLALGWLLLKVAHRFLMGTTTFH